jgi:hypothetical protein
MRFESSPAIHFHNHLWAFSVSFCNFPKLPNRDRDHPQGVTE